MEQHKIIMNFSVPPSAEDVEAMAQTVLESLPEELAEFCDSLVLKIDEVPDDGLQADLNLEDPFELVALFRKGSEISPGVIKKVANDDDTIFLFRRSLLDLWCETDEDFSTLVRQVIVEELGRNFEFSDDEIEEMIQRNQQGFL